MRNQDQNTIDALPHPSKKTIKHVRNDGIATRDKIIEILAHPNTRGASSEEIGRKIGISGRAVRYHLRDDPSIRVEARELFHQLCAPAEMLAIDRAMLKSAQVVGKEGVADRKLAYRVIDGFGDREDIGAGQELVVTIRCEDDFTGLAQEVGVRIRPDRSGAP